MARLLPSPPLTDSCAQAKGRSGRPSTSTRKVRASVRPKSSPSVPAAAKSGAIGPTASLAMQRAIARRVAPRMLWAEISSTEPAAQAVRSFPSASIFAITSRSSARFSAVSFLESFAPESFRSQAGSP